MHARCHALLGSQNFVVFSFSAFISVSIVRVLPVLPQLFHVCVELEVSLGRSCEDEMEENGLSRFLLGPRQTLELPSQQEGNIFQDYQHKSV